MADDIKKAGECRGDFDELIGTQEDCDEVGQLGITCGSPTSDTKQ